MRRASDTTRGSAPPVRPGRGQGSRAQRMVTPTSLLELVRCLCEVTPHDAEVVATALHMLRGGMVRREDAVGCGWLGARVGAP